jgi:hypothetical protein
MGLVKVYRVLILDDTGRYVLTSRRVFRGEAEAQAHADKAPQFRGALVLWDERRDEQDYFDGEEPPQ